MYKPGLHLLLNLHDVDKNLLENSNAWKHFILEQVKLFDLTQVGEVLHDFPEGGFTAVHALTESHLSIHTWPEYGLCTCDIFLSNFRQHNHEKVRQLGRNLVRYFNDPKHDWMEQER